jgi:5-methylcytosine-specific restriction endonuclease McrA
MKTEIRDYLAGRGISVGRMIECDFITHGQDAVVPFDNPKIGGKSNLYKFYLSSCAWRTMRNYIMRRDNHTCQICGEKATDVHHLTYKHIYNEHPFELVALCRICHENYHDKTP